MRFFSCSPGIVILTSLPLLLSSHGVRAQASIVSWQFPNSDGMIINYIDIVVLQWTGNYATPFLQMWCQNSSNEIGNDVVQGSNFPVTSSGRYSYIISKDDPTQTSFPVACHAQLATAQNGGGVDSPVGVTFVSLDNVQAKTFSLASTSSRSSSSTSSTSSLTSAGSSSPSVIVILPTPPPTATSSPNPSSTPATVSPAGLSSSAKAGIGIGIAIIVVLIAAAVILSVWRRRRNVIRKGEGAVQELNGDGVRKPELPGNERDARHEMEAKHGWGELGSEAMEVQSGRGMGNAKSGKVFEMPG